MLIILAVFSIFFGFVTKDMFIGLGSGFFADNALFIHPTHEIMLDTEFGVPTVFKLLPLLFTIVISFIFIVLTEYLSSVLIYFKLSRLGYNIFSFFNQRFLIELFYNKYITGVILKLGGVSTKIIDKGAVEYLGPYGLEKGLSKISYNIGYLNTGVITSYALYITTGLIFYTLFSFYLNTVIIILGIIISLSYNLNYSYTYEPWGFTLLYKSGTPFPFPSPVPKQSREDIVRSVEKHKLNRKILRDQIIKLNNLRPIAKKDYITLWDRWLWMKGFTTLGPHEDNIIFVLLYSTWCFNRGIATLDFLINYLEGKSRYHSYAIWYNEWMLKKDLFLTTNDSISQYIIMEDIVNISQEETWILLRVCLRRGAWEKVVSDPTFKTLSEEISEVSFRVSILEKTLIECDLENKEYLSCVLSKIKSSIQSLT